MQKVGYCQPVQAKSTTHCSSLMSDLQELELVPSLPNRCNRIMSDCISLCRTCWWTVCTHVLLD